MPEQEIEMSPSGELYFKIPQQKWPNDDAATQTSYFAAHPLIVNPSESNPDTFELHYLGLKVGGFEDIEDAKFNAREFARSVFQILGNLIKDS